MLDLISFVKEIADENPITEIADETNGCKYCGNAWCSHDFETAVREMAIPRYYSHSPDCLWIRANQIISKLRLELASTIVWIGRS